VDLAAASLEPVAAIAKASLLFTNRTSAIAAKARASRQTILMALRGCLLLLHCLLCKMSRCVRTTVQKTRVGVTLSFAGAAACSMASRRKWASAAAPSTTREGSTRSFGGLSSQRRERATWSACLAALQLLADDAAASDAASLAHQSSLSHQLDQLEGLMLPNTALTAQVRCDIRQMSCLLELHSH
jgi:hypothetical protein